MISKQLRPAIVVTFVLMVITGLVYPGVITAVAQIVFPRQANGSLVTVDGQVIGSSLIGQQFSEAWYFHPRPSAAGDGYDATASGGTNKGPTDRKLADTLIADRIAAAVSGGATKGDIPADMVTASASGLDPHISPANAQLQVARVAAARGSDTAQVRQILADHTEGRQLGFLGEPRVNVLMLNLALDSALPRRATADTAVSVTFGGFVDGYYAYDFGAPPAFDRAFTTQAVRHNEFNVNLAFVEMKLSGPRVRGRLALQAGTSVQSNYSGEPAIGSNSGPSLARHIQEAVAGYALTPSVWVDGGIFLSHIGMESFISRDNLTYTRSLSAEFTPYYESGAKLTWQASPRFSALVTVVNGWQNISENNQDKAVGARLDFAFTPTTTFAYYNFFGNESGPGLLRSLNGVGLRTSLSSAFTMLANFDYGRQQTATGGSSSWYSGGLIGKLQPAPGFGMSARVERYHDPDQVIVVTGSPAALSATTASFGVDLSPLGNNRALWRNEARGTWARDDVFPDRDAAAGVSSANYLLVTSLGMTF